nr:hypothetical protein [uncultured Aggregatibacter sp.]
MKTISKDEKKQCSDRPEYKKLCIFIICIFISELNFLRLGYLSSFVSLYVCFMLSVIDIYKTLPKKIRVSCLCFTIMLVFSGFYLVLKQNNENINQYVDFILSLLIPFVYYFLDYFMKPYIKKIQEYENSKLDIKNGQ